MSRINKLETHYKEQLKKRDIKNISDFIFSIVNADITKGKYARFLIEAFLNDKFLEEDLIGGLESTVGQAINLFDKHKHKLPMEYRSVYAVNQETGEALYQSPGDLWNSVKQFQGELSGKELKREEQEKIYRETEFVYKDEETGFQIISPLTKESAKWWGKGTRWCTSAENNNRFEHYAKYVPLLILLIPNSSGNVSNGEKKLQLWKYEDNIQFMDESDNTVPLYYIEKNWSLLEPICLWLNTLEYIPEQYRTKELCESAIIWNEDNLQYVPEELKTKELYEMAMKQNGRALRYVPNKLKTKEICELAVKQNGLVLDFVPERLRTKELCNLAVQNDGRALVFVPNKLRTKEFCEMAIKKNGMALEFVPYKYINKEFCELAVQQYGYALDFVPEKLKTPELCELAVQNDEMALLFVPKKYKTKELCEIAVKQNGGDLWAVPEEYKKELQHYVKNEILELEIPLEQYQNIFQEIKTLFPKKDVSLSYHHS